MFRPFFVSLVIISDLIMVLAHIAGIHCHPNWIKLNWTSPSARGLKTPQWGRLRHLPAERSARICYSLNHAVWVCTKTLLIMFMSYFHERSLVIELCFFCCNLVVQSFSWLRVRIEAPKQVLPKPQKKCIHALMLKHSVMVTKAEKNDKLVSNTTITI